MDGLGSKCIARRSIPRLSGRLPNVNRILASTMVSPSELFFQLCFTFSKSLSIWLFRSCRTASASLLPLNHFPCTPCLLYSWISSSCLPTAFATIPMSCRYDLPLPLCVFWISTITSTAKGSVWYLPQTKLQTVNEAVSLPEMSPYSLYTPNIIHAHPAMASSKLRSCFLRFLSFTRLLCQMKT